MVRLSVDGSSNRAEHWAPCDILNLSAHLVDLLLAGLKDVLLGWRSWETGIIEDTRRGDVFLSGPALRYGLTRMHFQLVEHTLRFDTFGTYP